MNEEQKPEELLEQEALLEPVDCAKEQEVDVSPDTESVEMTETAETTETADAPDTPEMPGVNTDELNATIEQLCLSKAQELHMLGYEHVTGLDVWNCVSSKYKELPPMHKLVNDILSLRSTKFMNWLMIKAQTE